MCARSLEKRCLATALRDLQNLCKAVMVLLKASCWLLACGWGEQMRHSMCQLQPLCVPYGGQADRAAW
jgi:hypothetical protein